MKVNVKDLIISIFIPVFLGGLVGLITTTFNDYSYLNKPSFAPPGIVFPIVWTILYALMGISYYIIGDRKKSYTYEIQLFVNLFWSIIFFVFELRLFAFFWLLLLIVLVIIMIYQFYKIDKRSAYLNIPYLLWIICAGVLNFSIYLLNR